MARKELTIAAILQELADEFDGVVAEREVFDRVLARRPSSAKNPYSRIREQIRFDGSNTGWIALGNGELMPLRTAITGTQFRIIPQALDLERGTLPVSTLRPFAPARFESLRILDDQGAVLADSTMVQLVRDPFFGTIDQAAIGLRTWIERTNFALGDSILATVVAFAPLTIQFSREQAEDFQAARVADQERELIDGLAALVAKHPHHSVPVDTTVLPLYARASWRTAYPGRPWQLLVETDPRVRTVAGDMLAPGNFRTPLELATSDFEQDSQFDDALFAQITSLQEQLLDSRRTAVERGLWDGTAPRVSTAQTLFDFEAGTSTTVYPGAVDALEDHTATIEEHIANGDYEEDWTSDDDLLGIEINDEIDDLGGLESINTIEDVQSFIEENPEIAAATRRLMESLTPDEQRRLDSARSIDDVQQVLGPHLAELLRTEPALFVPLTPDMYEFTVNPQETNGNGHSNGADSNLLTDGEWEDDTNTFGTPDSWVVTDGDDEDEQVIEFGSEDAVNTAVEHSSQLLDQFVEHQLSSGKSKATATARAGDLWLYADFLSRYYGRSLDLGDYATLDECLFFFYPRKVLNSSPRNAREFCTSAKQFYAFLKAESIILDDAFAIAMWQRRDQAARVVELYDQIDSESPQFERLFAHLFAPYTA